MLNMETVSSQIRHTAVEDILFPVFVKHIVFTVYSLQFHAQILRRPLFTSIKNKILTLLPRVRKRVDSEPIFYRTKGFKQSTTMNLTLGLNKGATVIVYNFLHSTSDNKLLTADF
jgi:hypothetical protein